MSIYKILNDRNMLKQRKAFLEDREKREIKEYNELKHNYVVCRETGTSEFVGVGDGVCAVALLERLRIESPRFTFETKRHV